MNGNPLTLTMISTWKRLLMTKLFSQRQHLLIYIFSEVKTTYRPDVFIHNGPGAMTRVLHQMCNKSDPNEWSATTCQGKSINF